MQAGQLGNGYAVRSQLVEPYLHGMTLALHALLPSYRDSSQNFESHVHVQYFRSVNHLTMLLLVAVQERAHRCWRWFPPSRRPAV